MEYATIASKYCCGVDLHARTMYVCIMDRDGKVRFHRNMKNDFGLLTQAVALHAQRRAPLQAG
jgi:hypothetical protein